MTLSKELPSHYSEESALARCREASRLILLMPSPTEHKTVQARILQYAQEIGWIFVPRDEAEQRRGFDADAASAEERARTASLFFDDRLYERVRHFNPKYKEAEGALVGELHRLHGDIYGNRDFLNYLRNQGKFLLRRRGPRTRLDACGLRGPGAAARPLGPISMK